MIVVIIRKSGRLYQIKRNCAKLNSFSCCRLKKMTSYFRKERITIGVRNPWRGRLLRNLFLSRFYINRLQVVLPFSHSPFLLYILFISFGTRRINLIPGDTSRSRKERETARSDFFAGAQKKKGRRQHSLIYLM